MKGPLSDQSASGSATRTLDQRSLDNAGQASWTGPGVLRAVNGASFNNQVGGTVFVLGDAVLDSQPAAAWSDQGVGPEPSIDRTQDGAELGYAIDQG